ncbi:hypothetical protein GGD68_006162 [Paraburkholderia fungorum]|uniref:Uncharacterized protein n=1 Tax=Paraburkholderia fungorum TaxID=134537 RepID=A0AAW3V1A8_9BURK|nr:hypothetical protein [Paraburkholderia fungorum]MBB6204428.1 hypothetical protein [Paraburkholderia fungorum]
MIRQVFGSGSCSMTGRLWLVDIHDSSGHGQNKRPTKTNSPSTFSGEWAVWGYGSGQVTRP